MRRKKNDDWEQVADRMDWEILGILEANGVHFTELEGIRRQATLIDRAARQRANAIVPERDRRSKRASPRTRR